MLATLLRPDAGEATIFGHDVVREPNQVRQLIGVTGQFASVDEALSATENLVIFGRLLGLSRTDAKAKAVDLLERFGLTDAARRPLKKFSGGMRRRLDLAASLIAQPPLIFLDEPTTGLDQVLEGGEVDLGAGESQAVAARGRVDDARQRFAHPRDEGLQSRARIVRQVVLPDILRESAVPDDRARVEREAQQQRLLPASAHGERAGIPRRPAEVGQPRATTLGRASPRPASAAALRRGRTEPVAACGAGRGAVRRRCEDGCHARHSRRARAGPRVAGP